MFNFNDYSKKSHSEQLRDDFEPDGKHGDNVFNNESIDRTHKQFMEDNGMTYIHPSKREKCFADDFMYGDDKYYQPKHFVYMSEQLLPMRFHPGEYVPQEYRPMPVKIPWSIILITLIIVFRIVSLPWN